VSGQPFWCLNDDQPLFQDGLQALSFMFPKRVIVAYSWVTMQVPTKHISPLTIHRFRKGVQTTQRFKTPKNPPAEYLSDKAKAESKDEFGSIGVGKIASGPMGNLPATATPRPSMDDLAALDILFHPDISWKEIRAAYKRKALSLHPDRNNQTPEATEKFKKMQQSYDNLSHVYGEAFVEKEVMMVLAGIFSKT